ncbi:acetyltransferase [Desulfobulbus sp.]|uniref:acetyltransferase n=1 Tax=Desulfobulbus sp. TaxID=895 RepID=UPI00286EEFA3|nr:acetyltransferase [Desulfobulbus sp.]
MAAQDRIDVFNGDADGICALHQLRLHAPRPDARLITGPKRDIALLERIGAVSGQRITVLDISLDRNRDALIRLLARGNRVFYADHHFSGQAVVHDLLETHLDPAPDACTSLIVDRLLAGAHCLWAIAGAFGDNLDENARQYARSLGLAARQQEMLAEIGLLLNYNGYGLSEGDLLIPPAELFREVHRFDDPFAFHRRSGHLDRLRRNYAADMARAADLRPESTTGGGRVFRLPATAWANRTVGVIANELSREQPALAHAILLTRPDNSLRVSVRAPLATGQGADELCRRYASGGGRSAAAGIDRLPMAELAAFLADFARHFPPL